MAKDPIVWMPGGGVGNDVAEAAMIVLGKPGFVAESVRGDILIAEKL